ncbi:malignant fibrous histiocytoma-amplified sequence 1 homolog [Branchiostoma floridae x Branchiostoma belcheri]
MTASEGDQKKLKAEYLRELMCRGIALEEQWQLSLWDKGLERVPSELTQLAELHVLDLGGNNLRELPAGFSHYLTNLGILDLKKNSFASFPEQILDLASVTELDLSYNKLKSIPAEISHLKRLQKFFLSQNYIQVLPNGICELSLLEELDISYNYLTYLPAKFGQLKRLRTLDLDHNKIPYIPPQVFELRELVEFDFSHNTAISGPLPCNIAFLTNLQVLWLSSNGLTLLPNCIQELVLLEELILDNNKLHNLPCDFKHLQRVKVLNLGFNCYEIFPHAVLALDRVEELFLSRNRLSHIPEEIGLLQHLRVLWLDHNNVESLPDSVTTLVNMEELSVQGNRLKCLPEGFGNLSNLDCLDVRENPLLQPPLEVCTNGVKAIAAFQEELQRVKVPVTPRFKLAFIGRRHSGKTQLKHSLNGNLDVPSTALSKFLDISTMTFDSGTCVDTVVYDFGGHALYHFAQQFFFTENCLYLLVVNLYEYKDSTFWDDVGFWLSVIIARVPYACVCIVGTHVDRCNGDEVEGRSLDIHKKISQMFSDMKTKSHLLSIANSMEEFLQESNVQRSVPSPSSPTRRPRYFQSSQNRVLSAVLPVNLGDDQRGIKHIQDLLPYLYSNVQLFRNSCLIVHTTWVHLEDMIKERQESLFITLEDFHSMAAIAGVPKRQRPEVLQWLEDRGSVLYLGNNNPHLRKYVIPTSVNLVKLFNCLFGHALRVQSEQRTTPHPNNTPASSIQPLTDDLLQSGVVSPYLLHTVLQEAGLTEPQEVVGRFLCDLGMFFPIPYHPSHSSAAMGDSEDGNPQQQQQPDTTGKDLVSYSVPWFRRNLGSHTGLRLTLPYYHTTVQIETMQIKCCVWHFCPPGLFERFTATVHPHIVHRMDVSNSCIVYRGKVPVLVELRMSQDLTCLLLTTKMTQVTTWSAWQAVVPLVRELCALLQEWPGMLQSLHVVCPHCLQQGAAEPHEFPGKLLTLPRPREPAATVRCPKGDGVDVSVALVYPPEPITTFESV